MKMLTRTNIPCWYELSWLEEEALVALRISNDIAMNFTPISEDAPIVASLGEEFGFRGFTGVLTENFGFNDGLRRGDEKQGFVEFLVEMPVVRQKTKTPCGRCSGSGQKEPTNDKCFSCDGTRKEHIHVWEKAEEISASLSVLLRLLEFPPDKDTTATFPQLLTVTSLTRKTRECGLWGTYGPALCRWLSSRGANTEIPEMVQAMKTAHVCMLGAREHFEWDFRAYIADQRGWLNVDCPGDACGLHPVHGSVGKREGYEFSCHNVDTVAQQLTLLAGLGALHDKARKELSALQRHSAEGLGN